jgi:tyrosine-protein kinase Etk/Wzc
MGYEWLSSFGLTGKRIYMTESRDPNSQFIYEKEVHLSDYLYVLLRRWKIAVVVFAVVFVGIAVYSFVAQPIYEASSTLEIGSEKKNNNIIDEIKAGGEGTLQTEIEKFRSRSLAEQVIRRLNLHWQITNYSKGLDIRLLQFNFNGDFPQLRIELTSSTGFRVLDHAGRTLATGQSGQVLNINKDILQLEIVSGAAGDFLVLEQQPIDGIVNDLLSSLTVAEVGKMTNVIRVAYRSSDPEQARDVVNLLVEGYMSINVAQRTAEAGKAVDFISSQLEGVKSKLDSSEQELQEYKVRTGRVTLGPEGNTLLQKVVSVEQQKADLVLKRQRIDFAIQELSRALSNNGSFTPPTIEGVPQLATLAGKLAELEAERKSMLNDYTPAHPAVIKIQSDINRVQNALLSTYRTVRQELALSESDLGKTLAGFEVQMGEIPEAELELAKRMRVNQVNSELYTFLLQKQQEASIAEASTLSAATVIDKAVAPVKPVKPDKKKNLALGFALGLMLGVGVIFLLDYMDQTIKTSEDVRDKLGLSILGIIPRIPFADKDAALPGKRLVTTLSSRSPVVEAFRSLRTNLNFITARESHKVILVTSSLPDEGKSTISGNLATIFAQSGAKVLLVGCDLRRPSLYAMFDQQYEPGLTDLLIERNPSAVRKLTNPKLDFLPSGRIPPNPAAILDSERMKNLIAAAREHYDYVILDSPPVLPVADAQMLAPLCDLVLVVLEPCRIPERAARQMVETLQAIDVKISGVILNDKSGRGFKYYGSYSYYGNKYYRGYYGESQDDVKDSPAVASIKRVWEKLNS